MLRSIPRRSNVLALVAVASLIFFSVLALAAPNAQSPSRTVAKRHPFQNSKQANAWSTEPTSCPEPPSYNVTAYANEPSGPYTSLFDFCVRSSAHCECVWDDDCQCYPLRCQLTEVTQDTLFNCYEFCRCGTANQARARLQSLAWARLQGLQRASSALDLLKSWRTPLSGGTS